ncbi:MAG: hypothetical protein ACJ74I_02735 [Gaiellaceae bacterium]
MNFSAHTIRRLASLAGLAAVVAAVAVPTAFAHPATEGGDDTSRAAVLLDLRSPDTSDVTAQKLGSLDPALATAMAGHQRLGDLRAPDTRDVTVNPIAQSSPVAAPATSEETNWGLVTAMFAAIGILFVGVGALAIQGHGKSHGTVKPA